MLLVSQCLLLLALFWGGWGEQPSVTVNLPSLSDEYAHSLNMPSPLQCDACKAIAYQLTKKFDEAHQKRKSLKRLPESEVYRLIEEVCSDKFKQYGVKLIDNQKTLSGPGLEADTVDVRLETDMLWSVRMMRTCYKLVGNVDEEEIYEFYLEDPKGLSKFLCRSNNTPWITDVCNLKPDSKKTENKEEL